MRFPDTIKHSWVHPGCHDLPTSSVISINGAFSDTENIFNPITKLTPLDTTYYRVKYKLSTSDPKGFLNYHDYEYTVRFGFQMKQNRFEQYPFFDSRQSFKIFHNKDAYRQYDL